MNSKNKIIVFVVAVVFIVLGGFILIGNNTPKAIVPIKIGLSLPLTGDLAFIGETDRNAAELAIDEIRNQKGIKRQYELVFEDDSFTGSKAVGVMKKFIGIDKVDAVISIGSAVGNAISPIAETSKIIHISMASDPVIAKGDYNFINWTRPQEEVTAMIQEMQKRGISKVAILRLNQQGFQAISQDFVEKAKVAGITVVEEIFNADQTDFRTSISKLQKENPQIYFLGAFDPEIGIIAKQIRELGIKTPLTSIESFGQTADMKPFEGQWYVDAASPTSEFVTKYQNKYGKAPGPAAANVYDSIHLLVKAFESVSGKENPTTDKVARALNSISGYSGALGPISVNSDGVFISQATVMMISNGKSVNAQ